MTAHVHSPLPAVPERHVPFIITPAQVLRSSSTGNTVNNQQTTGKQPAEHSDDGHCCCSAEATASLSSYGAFSCICCASAVSRECQLGLRTLRATALVPTYHGHCTTTPTCWPPRPCCSNCWRLLAGFSLEVASKLGYSSGLRWRSTGKDPRGAAMPAKGPSLTGGTQPLLLVR